jgi:TonB-linked SusC/RagA family outer membrane protein
MMNPIYHPWTKRLALLACIAQAPAFAQELASAYNLSETKKENTQTSARSLKQVLKEMETRFGIFFTYKNAALEDKIVQVDDKLLSAKASGKQLDEAISSLLEEQQLKYRKIDNIYVIYTDEDRINFRQLKRRAIEAGREETAGFGDIQSQVMYARLGTIEQYMQAKDIAVRGRVTGDDGAGLPGVNVLVKGTSVGTTTDGNGNFSITAPDNNSVLVFSFIGFVTEEVAIGGRTTIDVRMVPDVKALSEVVVVGYGAVEKKDLIGAVGTATSKDFGNVTVANAQQLIQGKIAGVQVANTSGLPGANVNIVVRGIGSFTNSEALYVIDGIQGGVNEFNSLPPYDIESVTVLKDASSVAIYGARAANGVVIVTTKRAKAGAPRVTYNGYYGFAQPWKKLDLMNSVQYLDLVNDITNGEITDKLRSPEVLVDRTDWQDEMFRTAQLTEHNIGLAGGTEKFTYLVSNTYSNQDAIVGNYNFQRNTLRLNLEENVGSRFKFGQQAIFRYTVTKGNTPSLTEGLRMPTYAPVYDPTNLGGFSRVTSNADLNDAANPLTDVYLSERRNRDIFLLTQLYGEAQIFEWLRFRSQLAVSFNNYGRYYYRQARANANLILGNQIEETFGFGISPILENFFTLNKKFGEHDFNLLLGNTYINGGVNREIKLDGGGFSNDELRNVAFAGQSRVSGGFGGLPQGGGLSYFTRLNYTFRNRYLLTASFRRDGSPVFPAANRFANFPAVGLGWRISEEPFMQNIPFLSELKLRASYGVTGNASIPLQRAVIWRGESNNIVYGLGPDEAMALGATVNQPIDPSTRWETTVQTDIGLDVGFFNDQLSFSLDYYNRDNRDLLVGVPVPLSSGFGGPYDQVGTVVRNAATAYNRGFEATAAYRGEIGRFRYGINGNVAYNRNQVVTLGAGQPFNAANVEGGYQATRTEKGQPIGSFYGYKVDRVVSTTQEVTDLNLLARERTGNPEAVYQASLLPGDILFKDLNGDGQVTEKDQTFLGSPLPRWNYGANLNLGFMNFDFTAGLFGVGDVSLWNELTYWLEGTSRPFNSSAALVSRWRQEGDVSEFPRAGQNANGNLNLRPSDRFVDDASFIRVRNLTLGYTLPESVLGLAGKNFLSSFRVYVTAQNPFTFTKFKGYDPEVTAREDDASLTTIDAKRLIFERGIVRNQFPQPRSILFGVQVAF